MFVVFSRLFFSNIINNPIPLFNLKKAMLQRHEKRKTSCVAKPNIHSKKGTIHQCASCGSICPSKSECVLTKKKKKKWVKKNNNHNEVQRVKKRLEAFSSITLSSENLPENWYWSKLEDSVLMIVDCHNKTAPYVDSGIPLIRTSNIRDGRFVWKNLRYVNQETYAYWSKRCQPNSGDIIFTREAPMGEAAIIPQKTKVCLGQRTMLIRPIENCVSANYLLLAITDPEFKKRSDEFAVGTGVKHYRVGDVSDLVVPVPPTEEQKEIVRRVESLFALADAAEKQYRQAKQRIDRLTQSILSKAFRGELVPQDPNDEPASVLLKKIQIERERLSQVKPKRKKASRKPVAKKNKTNHIMNLNDAPQTYLLDLLHSLGGETDAKTLWQKSELTIEDFYTKLKAEPGIEDNKSPDPELRKLVAVSP